MQEVPLKALVRGLAEAHVQGVHTMVQCQTTLHCPVLGEGVDDGVWPIVTQQSWHVALQAVMCQHHALSIPYAYSGPKG